MEELAEWTELGDKEQLNKVLQRYYYQSYASYRTVGRQFQAMMNWSQPQVQEAIYLSSTYLAPSYIIEME